MANIKLPDAVSGTPLNASSYSAKVSTKVKTENQQWVYMVHVLCVCVCVSAWINYYLN